MGRETRISWADHTFNPWRGCTKVSAGCDNCYAEAMSVRNPAVLGKWGPDGKRVVAAESYWRQPLKWGRDAKAAGERRRVFCASLADVFEDRPELSAPRRRLFRLVGETPSLDWLLLTKRPQDILRLTRQAIDTFDDPGFDFNAAGEPNGLEVASFAELFPNVWLGVSVEDQQRADERIPQLLQVPAAVRFLSVEPLLGPVDLTCHWYTTHNWHNWLTGETGLGRTTDNFASHEQTGRKVGWVIVGGESGPSARPCEVGWIRSLVAQCKAASVPVFVKQLGTVPVEAADPLPAPQSVESLFAHGEYDPEPRTLRLRDPKGGDMAEFPADLRVREVPGQ
jgi:protein gp37